MKKLITTLFFLYSITILAQDPIVTGTPANYTVIDENIELLFDITGVNDNSGNSIEGKDLYIWIFSSAGDGKTNGGDFNNSKESARLEKLSDTQYRFKFPIEDGANTYNSLAELFGAEAAPGSIETIGYLLKDKTATFQTSDYSIPFSPFKFDPAEVRTFPASVTTKDIVTFRFNQSFTSLSNPALTGAKNISVHIEPSNSAANAVNLETIFNGRYFQTGIIPAQTFQALNNAGTLRELKYYFFDTDNPTITSAEGTIVLKKAGN